MKLIFFIHVSNMKRKFNERNSIGHMVACPKLLTAICLGKRSNVCLLRVSLKKQTGSCYFSDLPHCSEKSKGRKGLFQVTVKSSPSCCRGLWYPIASLHLQPGSQEMNAALTAFSPSYAARGPSPCDDALVGDICTLCEYVLLGLRVKLGQEKVE